MANGWKILAIVFIILFVLESLFFIWATKDGFEFINNQNYCAYDICEQYPSYNYDSYTQECYCFENDEVVYQENLG